MHRSEEYIKRSYGRSVLEMAQILHEMTTGSFDDYNGNTEQDILFCLNEFLNNWEAPVHSKAYDQAVKNLILISLLDYENKKGKN